MKVNVVRKINIKPKLDKVDSDEVSREAPLGNATVIPMSSVESEDGTFTTDWGGELKCEALVKTPAIILDGLTEKVTHSYCSWETSLLIILDPIGLHDTSHSSREQRARPTEMCHSCFFRDRRDGRRYYAAGFLPYEGPNQGCCAVWYAIWRVHGDVRQRGEAYMRTVPTQEPGFYVLVSWSMLFNFCTMGSI